MNSNQCPQHAAHLSARWTFSHSEACVCFAITDAEVWNGWGTILKGIKWMFRSDAPLLMNPMPSWHKYSWMAEFVAQIPRYRQNTIDTVRLAIAAREHLLEGAEKYGFDFNVERRGILHFYGTTKEYKHAEQVTKLYAEGGLERYAVTPDEIAELEPALAPGCADGSYVGGFFTPSDFTGGEPNDSKR
jgi:D-amino-acid dehydrogenase